MCATFCIFGSKLNEIEKEWSYNDNYQSFKCQSHAHTHKVGLSYHCSCRCPVTIWCQAMSSHRAHYVVNTLRPRQNGRHFIDGIFKCIFRDEKILISTNISLNFVSKRQINNIPALVQIMAWRRSGDKPFSEPMMVSLLTHICVTRPQWVKHVSFPVPLDSKHIPLFKWLSNLVRYCGTKHFEAKEKFCSKHFEMQII